MTEAKFKVYFMGGATRESLADTIEELDRVGAVLEVLPALQREEEIIEKTGDADALILSNSPITRHVLSSLKNCKVVLRTGVGYDVIDVPAATDLGIAVVNLPDMWTREVANQAMALLMACNRKVVELDADIKSGQWSPTPPYNEGPLFGETVGILGLGRIGSAFARRASGFEFNIIAHDPYQSDNVFQELGVERVTLDDLFKRSDYISCHTPLTDETRHIVNEDVLKLMKPTAYLINTSRGPVVEEAAVIKALQEGWIAGAGLDVLEKEPPDVDNPLLKMKNVVLSPHAGHYSEESMRIRPRRYGSEVALILEGKMPENIVNIEVRERLTLI